MIFAIDQLAVVSFLALLVWAAISDGARFIIPNRVCAGIVLLFPIHVLASPEPVAWAAATALALVVMGLGTVAFARGWAGGGDVKLFAGSVLWAGPDLISPLLLITAVTGGLLAAGALASTYAERRKASRLGSGGDAVAADLVEKNKPVLPYGIAIAMGGAFVAVQLLRG